jgi:hypothetical protein
MEPFGSHYAVLVNSPELRRYVMEAAAGAQRISPAATSQHPLSRRLATFVRSVRAATVAREILHKRFPSPVYARRQSA